MKIALDTDCIIGLFRPSEKIHKDMCKIENFRKDGKIEVWVSLKTIVQVKDQDILTYVNSLSKLPNFPIGAWNDAVGSWNEQAGTWDDARKNENLQNRIHTLTKTGVDIRDRGILLDAILGSMDALITNDRGLSDCSPSKRILKEYGINILTPEKAISWIENNGKGASS